jgi:hypothetical protein
VAWRPGDAIAQDRMQDEQRPLQTSGQDNVLALSARFTTSGSLSVCGNGLIMARCLNQATLTRQRDGPLRSEPTGPFVVERDDKRLERRL